MNHPTLYSMRWLRWHDLQPAPGPLRGVFRGILGRGVPPGSPNPDPISEKKMSFSTPVFSPISKIHSNFQTWSILACSRLSDSGGGSPVSSRFIFVFALSQFSGPNYLGAWNRLGLIRQKLCHHYQIRAQTKTFVKCISNSRISISFLFIWNWKDKFVYTLVYAPVVPSNPSLPRRRS